MRYNRNLADKQLEEFLDRVDVVNANYRYAYRVGRVALFGSYLNSNVETVGDIDLALYLVERFDDYERQQRLEHMIIQDALAAGRRFLDHYNEIGWPSNEVSSFLSAGEPMLSFHPYDDLKELGVASKDIFPRETRRLA